MPLRILIGYSQPGCRGTARALCVAGTTSEIEAARAADHTSASHGIITSPPMVRKRNPNYRAGAEAAPEPEPSSGTAVPLAAPEPEPSSGTRRRK